MKKIIFLPIMMTMALAACGESEPEQAANWSVEIKGEMNTYIGTVLPYVSFGEGFYHEWGTDRIYSIGDTSSVNVLKGYGALLSADKWTEYNIKEDEITYKKQNSYGYLTLKADFSAGHGNNISVAVRDSEGEDPFVDDGWSDDIEAQMTQYLGEVLPFVALDESSIQYDVDIYTEEDDGEDCNNFYIYDNNSVNVVADYGTKLKSAGFVEGLDDEEEVCYSKTTNKGELVVYCDWYSDLSVFYLEEQPGNLIDAYFYPSGGVDPTPTSGSISIVIGSIPTYASDTEFGTKTFEPGLTIATTIGKGSTAPRFWTTTDNDKQLRLYAENTITFTAEGITKIEFTWSVKKSQTMSASTGTFTKTSSMGTWEGTASTVKLTVGSVSGGQFQITKIVVYGEFAGGEGGDPVDPVDPTGDTRTVQSIAEDILVSVFGSDADPSNQISYSGGDAYIGVVFEGVSDLEEACEAGIYYLPTYLDEYEAPAAGTWDDNSDGYFATYLDLDNLIFVEVGTYEDDGDLVTQYCIYLSED